MPAHVIHEGFIDGEAPEKVRSLDNFKIKNPNGGRRDILVSFSNNFRVGGIDISDCPPLAEGLEQFMMGKKPRPKSGGWATHKARKKAEKERSGKRVVRGAAQ